MGVYSWGMSIYSIILASGSPRRRDIMDTLAVPYEAVVADVCEVHWGTAPAQTVAVNARRKHDWCRARYAAAWVIAADTVVVHEGVTLGKPTSVEEARAWLSAFAGGCQQVLTGVVVSPPDGSAPREAVVSSEVCFLAPSQIDIDGYLAAVSPLDKAGGYNVAERGELLLASYRGSWTNIMGLPREWLVEQLADILPVPPPESHLTPLIPEENDA
jgi:septum formation protein